MENEKQENVTMNDYMSDIEKNVKKIYPEDIIKGKIISVNEEEVLVNIDFYADGIIPKNEYSNENFSNLNEVATVGQEIDVMVLKVDDGDGNVLLSKKRADQIVVWDDLKEIFEKGETVDLTIKEVVKGGVIGYYKGIRGFIPASQLSVDYVSDLSTYVGASLKVKLIDFEKNRKVVFSHKIIEEKELEAKRQELLNTIEKDKKYTGTVKRLTKFGAFVDIGGIDGLIRNTDLSWKRIKHPSEVVKEGDKVEVYVIDFNKEDGKISLGLKNVEDNPWHKIEEEYKVGDVLIGKVTRLTSFGAFVELKSGVEGLVHISEISEERINKPSDVLEEGQEVKVKLTRIDKDKKKLSLSIKEAVAEETRVEIPDEYKSEQNIGTSLGDILKIKLD